MRRDTKTLSAYLLGGLAFGLLFGAGLCATIYAAGDLFTWKFIPFIFAVCIGEGVFVGYAMHIAMRKFADTGIQRRRLKDLWADKDSRSKTVMLSLFLLLIIGLTFAALMMYRTYSTPLTFLPVLFLLPLIAVFDKPAPQPWRITFDKHRVLPALLKGLAFSLILFAACIAYFGAVHMLPLWLGIVLAVGGVVNGLMLGAMLSLAESLQVTAIATARHEPRDETSTLNIEH